MIFLLFDKKVQDGIMKKCKLRLLPNTRIRMSGSLKMKDALRDGELVAVRL